MESIALVTTFWGRPEITEQFLRYYKRIRNVQIYATVSDPVSKELAIKYGIRFIEYKNLPLSEKWQEVLRHAINQGHDYYVIIGSDDFISSQFFVNILDKCKNGEAIGLSDIMLFDRLAKEMSYMSVDYAVGCGRVYSLDFLKKLDYLLWIEPFSNKGIENDVDLRIKRKGLELKLFKMKELGCLAIDLKSSTNIWSYEHFRNKVDQRFTTLKDMSTILARYEMQFIMYI